MRQCEGFLDDYDAWLMPVMPDAAFAHQKQTEPLVIDGRPYPYFFAGTVYCFLANLTSQPALTRSGHACCSRSTRTTTGWIGGQPKDACS